MSDQPKSLSEISHLFLSGVRAKTQGPNKPMRIPPQPRTDMTVDLTPEEFAQVFGEEGPAEQPGPLIGPVTAVIASHLGTQQLARARDYAAHLCGPGMRVGLIAVDASEFRLSVFERQATAPASEPQESEMLDARKMGQSLEELAWDVDRWLLLMPSPRAPEARSMLRDINQWTLLSTCDHEGVVSCYRTLKGLSDLNRPKLSLATLDSASDAESNSAYQRLASVCGQFLDWSLDSQTAVTPTSDVSEHVVLWCNGTRDKAQLASAPQWQVVTDFLARARKSPRVIEQQTKPQPAPAPVAEPISAIPQALEPVATPVLGGSDIPEVIDLPNASADAQTIVSAVIRGGHELVECPVKPPMYAQASLAVSRDHRLIMVAVAGEGLGDLQQIGKAYQWLIENRSLVAMAVPQMSIDAHQLPQLQLLVDHADMAAQSLGPILHAPTVQVRTYRKLRWAGKTGLLLEAA